MPRPLLTVIVEHERVEGLATRLLAHVAMDLLHTVLIHYDGVAETLASTLNRELLTTVAD